MFASSWTAAMSVLYRFHHQSVKEMDEVPLDSAYISVGLLKKQIVLQKGMAKSMDFDLCVENAVTNEGVYSFALVQRPQNTWMPFFCVFVCLGMHIHICVCAILVLPQQPHPTPPMLPAHVCICVCSVERTCPVFDNLYLSRSEGRSSCCPQCTPRNQTSSLGAPSCWSSVSLSAKALSNNALCAS